MWSCPAWIGCVARRPKGCTRAVVGGWWFQGWAGMGNDATVQGSLGRRPGLLANNGAAASDARHKQKSEE